jgi:hypothetical protein
MESVLLGVADVVDRVDPPGEQTEGQEAETDSDRHIVVTEGAGGAGRRDHEQVLDPLPRAECDQSRQDRPAAPILDELGRGLTGRE